MESEVQTVLAEVEVLYTQMAHALALQGHLPVQELEEYHGEETYAQYCDTRMEQIKTLHDTLQKQLGGNKALRLVLQAMALAETRCELRQAKEQQVQP